MNLNQCRAVSQRLPHRSHTHPIIHTRKRPAQHIYFISICCKITPKLNFIKSTCKVAWRYFIDQIILRWNIENNRIALDFHKSKEWISYCHYHYANIKTLFKIHLAGTMNRFPLHIRKYKNRDNPHTDDVRFKPITEGDLSGSRCCNAVNKPCCSQCLFAEGTFFLRCPPCCLWVWAQSF